MRLLTQTYSAASGGFNIVVNPGENTAVEFATADANIEFDSSGVSLWGDTTHTIDTEPVEEPSNLMELFNLE